MHRFEPSPGRILVVDDKVEELALLVETLRLARFDIAVAFDGARGYKRALARPPDLILLDVQLGGGMNGFALCRLFKADANLSRIPVIFLTASKDLEERLTGLREGAVDYIIKPFEPEEVIARVQIHLKLAATQPDAGTNPGLPSAPQSDAVLVEAACRLIEQRLGALPSLSELAKAVGTYEKRLTRAFREQKGMSVFEFAREARLLLVRRLLACTSLNVTDIAVEAGFSSAANLATVFKARFQCTPSEYRSTQAADVARANRA